MYLNALTRLLDSNFRGSNPPIVRSHMIPQATRRLFGNLQLLGYLRLLSSCLLLARRSRSLGIPVGSLSNTIGNEPWPRALTLYLFESLLKVPPTLPAYLRRAFSVAKTITCILWLVNMPSFPLVWHWSVFIRSVLRIYVKLYLHRLSTFLHSPATRRCELAQWYQRLCPVGEDPMAFEVVEKAWASPDACDFNLHLSNSSYPKVLDGARFKAVLKMCPTFLRMGGRLPLAGTHFQFMKEIPLFARYEIRVRIAAWDEKWMYIVTRFVIPPTKRRHNHPESFRKIQDDAGEPPAKALLHSVQVENASASCVSTPESDGATIHCISVSVLCFKIGRITVPPAIVLAAEGFSRVPSIDVGADATTPAPPPRSATSSPSVYSTCSSDTDVQQPTSMEGQRERFSHANPPPSFLRALELWGDGNGDPGQFRTFLCGGWRELPRGDRWWEDALGGEIDRGRKENMEWVRGMKLGMAGAAAHCREYEQLAALPDRLVPKSTSLV